MILITALRNVAGLSCYNCGTSDTPGWRAGETPDQKLCNGKKLHMQFPKVICYIKMLIFVLYCNKHVDYIMLNINHIDRNIYGHIQKLDRASKSNINAFNVRPTYVPLIKNATTTQSKGAIECPDLLLREEECIDSCEQELTH